MVKLKRLEVRLSDEEFMRLKAYAKQKDVSMAKVLRGYIKRLPEAQS
jgi:hypothetical protein